MFVSWAGQKYVQTSSDSNNSSRSGTGSTYVLQSTKYTSRELNEPLLQKSGWPQECLGRKANGHSKKPFFKGSLHWSRCYQELVRTNIPESQSIYTTRKLAWRWQVVLQLDVDWPQSINLAGHWTRAPAATILSHAQGQLKNAELILVSFLKREKKSLVT